MRGNIANCLFIIILFQLLSPSLSHSSGTVLFERIFVREKGAPTTETVPFSVPSPHERYRLVVTNGKGDGTSRCSSAVIDLNGITIVGPSDLNQERSSLQRSVDLEKTNLFSVTLKSSPGSFLTLKIFGGDDEGEEEEEHCGARHIEIASWGVDPNPFSPNGDGLLDTTALTAEISLHSESEDHGHTFALRSHWDIGSVPVVTDTDITMPDQSIADVSLTWDGAGLPAGPYPFTFYVELIRKKDAEDHHEEGEDDDRDDYHERRHGRDEDDNAESGEKVVARSSSVSGTLYIDLSAPLVTITSPMDGAILGTPETEVSGTVDDHGATIEVNGVDTENSAGAFQSAVALVYGANSIAVSATDAAGNEGNAAVNVIMDNVSPAILIDPTPEYTSAPALVISGRIDDITSTTVTIQDRNATVPAGGGTYSIGVDLSEGLNTLTVTARDSAGNTAADVVTIISDTILPSIMIDPVPEFTSTATLELKGSVVDQTASVVTIQGKSAAVPAGGGTYSLTVDLAEGPNTLTVTVKDSAGNTSEAAVSITLDATPPAVKIVSPSADSYTKGQETAVSGTISDATATGVTVNGITAAVSGGSFSVSSLPLVEGQNSIKTVATDSAGNTASDEVFIISDAKPPVVTIEAPADGMRTNIPGQKISGTVDENISIDKVTVNGAPISNSSGRFEYDVSLSEGENRFTVEAFDKAGNSGSAVVSVTLDTMAPGSPVIDQLPEITNLTAITLEGSSEPNARIRITGGIETTCDVSGRFSVSVSLNADATNTFSVSAVDETGNEGTPATVSIVQDSVPPSVSGYALKADPKVTLLIPISITFSEPLDPSTVNAANITVRGSLGIVDGAYSLSGNEVVFNPSAEFVANQTFVLAVGEGVKDKAGNGLSPIYTVSFDTLRGPAFIVGEVYDDTTGLPLEGAVARLMQINDTVPDPVPSATSDAMGRFSLSYQGVSGEARIEITKIGYTKVLRNSFLWPNKSMTIFDARLASVTTQPISASGGGTLADGDTSLSVPAGSMETDASMSIKSLSQQGIVQRLPLGWSPVYGVDIAPSGIALKSPAVLTIKNAWALTAGSFAIAFFDEGSRTWVSGSTAVSPDVINVEIAKTGQYLLIVPDTLPASPPMPQNAGEPMLPSVDSPPGTGTADVKVLPPAVLSREGARGLTKVLVTTPSPIPSGTAIEARITEKYTLNSGEVVTPEVFTQDITVYAVPAAGQPNTLSAEFPTTPSKIYPLGTLYYGKVSIDIFLPSQAGQPSENVIGEAGGTVTGPDGTTIIVPPSAVTEGTAVVITPLAEQDLPVKDASGVVFLGGLVLQMKGGAFKPGIFPQFAIPGLTSLEGTRVIVSRVETMNGKSEIKAVAVASVSGGRVVTGRCLAGADTCIYTGRYAFYAPARPIGFLSGTVMKAGSPATGSLVLVDNLPFKALADAAGRFEMASLEGPYLLTAYETSAGQRATDSGTIAADEIKDVLLTLSPYNPKVTGVLPADKAVAADLKAQVKVTFSDPIDPLTLDGSTFMLIQAPPLISDPDIVVQGHMSVLGQGNAVVFVPDAELKANTIYHVRLTSTIKDAFGNTLIPFESVFTTSNVLGNEALVPGTLKASMPDAEGYVIVRGGVGLTYGGAPVVIINKTKNVVVTVAANEDGSFMAKIKADLADEIVVEVKDLLGNTTTLSTGLLQNDDGTAAVGAKGGTIYGPGGIMAVIPEGAFDSTIAVQVTMLPGDAVKDVKINTEIKTAGVFKIDMGGVTAKNELKISIPAPAWITPEHQVLLAKVVNVRGYDELTLACPAILKDGQLVSTSPPFDGVTGGGNYTFVSWVDASKGTAYVMMNAWMTQDIGYTIGDYDFVFSLPIERQKPMVITIPVNKLYDVVISDSSGNSIKTIPVQGPPARGQFAEEIIRVTDDTIAPTVFTSSIPDGSTGILLTDNIVIEMSELIDPATVDPTNNPDAIIVTDSQGNRIQGTFYLAADQKTLVFVPKYGYKYNETYTVAINGVKDLGGNAVEAYTSKFTTFPTEDLGTISAPAAMAIDKYKNYIVVKGVNTALGDLVHNSTIWIYDVSDPQNPQLAGSFSIYGYVQDIKVLTDASITDRSGKSFNGDFLVAVGGRTKTYASLILVNITDPSNPVFMEEVYLAWNPGTSAPPDNVPAAAGEAYEVALIGTNAYSATHGVGIQAINLLEVVPPHVTAQANAIGGTVSEPSYKSISKVRNNLVAVKNGTLSILSPQLQTIGEFGGLNFPYSVTGVEAFPIDIDDDGNLGEFEDNDGDATSSKQETFDLAFVSTSDGLVIVDVTDPGTPKEMAVIPMTSPGRVVVNRAKRLAYASVGNDLYAISLRNPSGIGLIDKDKDGRDDRIVAIKPGYGFIDAVIEMDDLGRELLYLANYTDGQMRVVDLNTPKPKVVLVDENGFPLGATLQPVSDGQHTYDVWMPINAEKLEIKNNASTGDPEMPIVRARVMWADPSDEHRVLNRPANVKQTVTWKAKLDYQVPLKTQSRSRGYDEWTLDGVEFNDQTISQAIIYTIDKGTWGTGLDEPTKDFLGGGKLKIEATVVNEQKTSSTKAITLDKPIEGQTFPKNSSNVQPGEDPFFKKNICLYLENPTGATGYQALLTELGHDEVFRILAYKESRYQHFCPSKYGKPVGSLYPKENSSGDGGFGIMQLTDWPVPSYLQIWNWQENINGGVAKVKESLAMATYLLKGQYGMLPSTDSVGKSILRMETYHQYGPHHKGSTYWTVDKKGDWVFTMRKWLDADTAREIEDNVDNGNFSTPTKPDKYNPDMGSWEYDGE